MSCCKICGGLLPVGVNKGSCPFCGTPFDLTVTERPTAPKTEAPIRREPVYEEPRTSRVYGGYAGDEIYRMLENSACEINCIDANSAGSGMLFTTNGYVLTNHHVVSKGENSVSQNIIVTLAGERARGKVISYEPYFDLAIIKLENVPSRAKKVRFGDSSMVKNGERIYFIGNSLGEGLCMTSGIISDKLRKVGNQELIMSDAQINPGNSGGPMVNEQAQVIGVCVSQRTGANGMKYAIPSNDAVDFIREVGKQLNIIFNV